MIFLTLTFNKRILEGVRDVDATVAMKARAFDGLRAQVHHDLKAGVYTRGGASCPMGHQRA